MPLKASTLLASFLGAHLAALAAPALPALASTHQDQLVSGGGKANGTATHVGWAALGEPVGGRMSGGGFIIHGGGAPPGGNAAPSITAFSPADKSRFHRQDVATLSATASDAENDPLQYRFLLDGTVLQDWSALTTATWDTAAALFGWHTLRVEVKDSSSTASKEHRAFLFHRPPSP